MAQTLESLRGSSWSAAAVQTERFEVVQTTREAARESEDAAPPELVLDIERHTPDGAGVSSVERRWLPWVIGVLSLAGISVVAAVLGITEGWRAGLLGAGAVLTGCCCGWIVVWGAGLIRAGEERQITHEVEEFVVGSRDGG